MSEIFFVIFYCNGLIVELLLTHGAHIDAQNSAGSTAIYQAIINNRTEIVAKLIEKGADINRRYSCGRSESIGYTLLELAQSMAKAFPEQDFSKVIKLIQEASKAQ